MVGLESDTIGGYNGMLEKQKKTEGEVLVSTVLFDDVSEVLYDRIPLDQIPQMTAKEYYVRGCTALLDAMGKVIHYIANIHKYTEEEERPEKTFFVITTDGLENASHEYTYRNVKKMVEQQKEKYGWEFSFFGANIDAIKTAEQFGISEDRAVNFNSDHIGTVLQYDVLSDVLRSMRKSASPIDASWKKRLDDYKKRKK